mmetsp:Transcript_1844/g.7131  ORF Transcript_1844/g.7131 Transcript_1844/m.7131 type:complete len:171 (+) Transcript_1844:639-1151(+)
MSSSPAGFVVERGLVSRADRCALRRAALDKFDAAKRRTVETLDDGAATWRAATSTRVRLDRRDVPAGLIEALTPPGLAVKQIDVLVYGPGDATGWHDHAGESRLFLVARLNDSFEGGVFEVRRDDVTQPVDLRAGDVVYCASRLEHRATRVVSGMRLAMNLDFWTLSRDR